VAGGISAGKRGLNQYGGGWEAGDLLMPSTRRLFLIVAMLAAAAPALASPPPKEKAESPQDKEAGQSVEFTQLVFPVFNNTGKLENYLYVNARMKVGDGKDPWKYREKAHFIRDAVIRAAHKTSFNIKGDTKKLDEKLAAAECLKAANAVIGEPGALVSMTFTQIASQQ